MENGKLAHITFPSISQTVALPSILVKLPPFISTVNWHVHFSLHQLPSWPLTQTEMDIYMIQHIVYFLFAGWLVLMLKLILIIFKKKSPQLGVFLCGSEKDLMRKNMALSNFQFIISSHFIIITTELIIKKCCFNDDQFHLVIYVYMCIYFVCVCMCLYMCVYIYI